MTKHSTLNQSSKRKNLVKKTKQSEQIVLHQKVKEKSVVASYRHTADGVRIRHSEYVGELTTGSSTIDYQLLFGEPINPGNDRLFPWLAPVAVQYEKWKIHSLKVEFIPASSAVVDGVAIMYIDYDPQDQGALTMVQAMNMYGSKPVSVFAYNSVSYKKKEDSYNWYYTDIYNSYNPTKLVPTSYPGWVRVGCSKVPANKTLGFLKISYDIELTIPQIPTGRYSLANKADMMGRIGETVLDINGSFVRQQEVYEEPLSTNPSVYISRYLKPAINGRASTVDLKTGIAPTDPIISTVFYGYEGDVKLSPGALVDTNSNNGHTFFECAFNKPGNYILRYNIEKYGQSPLSIADQNAMVANPTVMVAVPDGAATDISVTYDGSFYSGKAAQVGGGAFVSGMAIVAAIYLGPSCFRSVASGIQDGLLDTVRLAIGFDTVGTTSTTWFGSGTSVLIRSMTATVTRFVTTRAVNFFMSRTILPTIQVFSNDGSFKYPIHQTKPLITKLVSNSDQSSSMRKRLICGTPDHYTGRYDRDSTAIHSDQMDVEDVENERQTSTLEQIRFDQYFSPGRRG